MSNDVTTTAIQDLHGKRVRLETIDMSHLNGLWPHFNNPKITPFLAWETHPDIAFSRKVIGSLIRSQEEHKGMHWTLIYNDEVCGLVSLIDIRKKHLSWTINRAELAFWVAPAFQGKGLISESCSIVLKYAFTEQNFHKIIIAHAHDNIASERVVNRLNFRFIGKEQEAFQKNGVWHDLKHYELLEKNFL